MTVAEPIRETAGRRALVCEDDTPIRTMIAAVLRREQFLVDTTCDGSEAIGLLEEQAYDLIILDLMMPNIDGYGVVRHLQENLPRSLKRIIITTAANQAFRQPFPGEICHVLEKPFDMDELVRYARECSDDTLTRERRGTVCG